LAEKGPKPKTEVTILDRREITTYPKLKQPLVQLAITYAAAKLPPRTIFIEKAKWSKEAEVAAIKKDMDEQAKTKPETIEV